jgi:hypothetical protein
MTSASDLVRDGHLQPTLSTLVYAQPREPARALSFTFRSSKKHSFEDAPTWMMCAVASGSAHSSHSTSAAVRVIVIIVPSPEPKRDVEGEREGN